MINMILTKFHGGLPLPEGPNVTVPISKSPPKHIKLASTSKALVDHSIAKNWVAAIRFTLVQA